MKIKIGRLKIKISLSSKRLIKPKAQYLGIICDVCGQRLKGDTKGLHLIEKHPEYACKRVHVSVPRKFDGYSYNSEYLAYECLTCGKRMSGVSTVVHHYQQFHPEKLDKKK